MLPKRAKHPTCRDPGPNSGRRSVAKVSTRGMLGAVFTTKAVHNLVNSIKMVVNHFSSEAKL